ncbi:hypothetical protein [Pedobacter sp. MR2016-24]|uniref:hypothetical protein n=1 Tax=Pedobacter sp. MR2016-24 TaxID=2994466 RepID=UPI0022460132|nr:hypothetical protein [Pedobacter sp. MR2016-24]MCX2485023.1 hypothetical protein [Pedobacter sp. MR2016-24]
MVLYTIKRNLGSIIIGCCLLACNNSHHTNEKVLAVKIDSCQLSLSFGDAVMAKMGECRYCHLRGDVPRFEENVPTLTELAAMDSLKISNFIFIGGHSGMYKESSSPLFKRKLDSLDDCEKRNLIHFIKDYKRSQIAN